MMGGGASTDDDSPLPPPTTAELITAGNFSALNWSVALGRVPILAQFMSESGAGLDFGAFDAVVIARPTPPSACPLYRRPMESSL